MQICVVDWDDVLFPLNKILEERLQLMGYDYHVDNVKTWDFNQSLPKNLRKKYDLGVDRKTILEQFTDVSLWQDNESRLDKKSVDFIKQTADEEKFYYIIYTQATTELIAQYKDNFLQKLFEHKNIDIVVTTANKEPLKFADYVLDDCIDNLHGYKESTKRILVDKPYNKGIYNKQYQDILRSGGIQRYADTFSALNDIVKGAV